MNEINLEKIKVIGFDLDQTLYPKSPEIDEAIQAYIAKRIAEYTGDTVEEAGKKFSVLFADGISGTKALEMLGVPNDDDIVQMALERADIAKFLAPNAEVLKLLQDIKEQYDAIDLITGSDDMIARDKLEKLEIPSNLFDVFITSDMFPKSNGDAYRHWLAQYPELGPENFLYIGDRKGDYLVPKELGINAIMVNIAEPKDELDCLQLSDVLDLRKYLLN